MANPITNLISAEQRSGQQGSENVSLALHPKSTTNTADFTVRSGHYVQITLLDGSANISFLRVDSGESNTGLTAPFTPCNGAPLTLCPLMRSRPIGYPGSYRLVSTGAIGTVTAQIEEFPLDGQDFVSLTCGFYASPDPCAI